MKHIIRSLLWVKAFVVFGAPVFAQELRGIKGPVEYPRDNTVFLIALIVGLFAAAGLAVFLIKHFAGKKPAETALSPPESALKEIDGLEGGAFASREKCAEYFSRLSEIVRTYIEEQFGIRAPDMTTEEFLQFIDREKKIQPEYRAFLQEFLESADRVKFAKFQPAPEEAENSRKLAKIFIEETSRDNVNAA